MSNPKTNIDELHVARAYAMQPCNSEHKNRVSSATVNATGSLKALAGQVLSRNRQCNHHATVQNKSCNSGPKNEVEKLHFATRVATDELRAVAGDDWDAISLDEEQLLALEDLVIKQRQLQAGGIPEDYVYQGYCQNCGPVWLPFPGSFRGCPHCLVKK